MEDANAAMKEAPKVVLRCKLCMVGDAGVGKTALTEVYTHWSIYGSHLLARRLGAGPEGQQRGVGPPSVASGLG